MCTNSAFSDPKIHVDLLRFCEHTRLAFLARSVPPDVMMRPVDVNLDHLVIGVAFFTNWFCFCSGFHTGLNCIGHSPTRPGRHIPHSDCTGIGLVPRDNRIATPSGWFGHYASACFGHGSFLQRDSQHGLLARFAPSRSSMGCWAESGRSHHLEMLVSHNSQTASRPVPSALQLH